jgi:alanine racemase
MSRTWVEINRSALRDNATALKRWSGRAKLMAIVKANAYGHGLVPTVQSLRGLRAVNWFGCDSLDEALQIKALNPRQPVLVMGYVPLARLKEALRAGVSLVAYNRETLSAVGQLASARYPAKIHLKIETGTSRQGIWPADLPKLIPLVQKSPHLQVEGLTTHYANIEDTADPRYAMGQLERFHHASHLLESQGVRPQIRHTAASAAALLYPVTRFDLVRTGLALYGLWPSSATRDTVLANGGPQLKPVLTWKTQVAQVKALPKGTPVSYGLTEKVKRDSRIAVLPVGYWDGFDRHLSSKGEVLVNGRRAKVLGRVCMNMTVVDVTDCGAVRPEQAVVLLGSARRERISAEELALRIGTINYEVVTRINPLIERRLV